MLHKKSAHSTPSLIAILLSLLLILLGTIGLILLQKPLKETSFDLRQQAAELKSCNESCDENSECESDHFCYKDRCRLADNPTSATCESKGDQGLDFPCNHYCADSRECESDLVCLENRCRRADNPDDINCFPSDQAVQEQVAAACNVSCTSHAECEVNMRCYGGVCRLASNPASTTCQPAAATAVTPTQASAKSFSTAPPKGGSAATLSAQPATQSATPAAVVRPTATPSPTPPPTIPKEETALDALLNSLQESNISISLLSMLAVGLGAVILLVILIPRLFARNKNRAGKNQSQASIVDTAPKDKYQQELEKRLAALKQESQTGEAGPPPATLSQNKPTSTQASVFQVPTSPTPPSNPTVPPVSPPKIETSTSGSDMMSRVKNKGVKTPGAN